MRYYCKECGYRISKEYWYCPNCSTKIKKIDIKKVRKEKLKKLNNLTN